MKKIITLLIVTSSILGCATAPSNEQKATIEQAKKYTPPPAGTIIAADSSKVPDELNDFYFAVSIKSTEHSNNGTYDIFAHYGYNDAHSSFTLPKSDKNLIPVLKKSSTPFTYVVGFYWGDDDIFYDYYEVSAERGQIKMKYLKAYSFQ